MNPMLDTRLRATCPLSLISHPPVDSEYLELRLYPRNLQRGVKGLSFE